MSVMIGDGTAPKGWPAYSAQYGQPTSESDPNKLLQGRVIGVICKFNGCGHTGSLGAPAHMDCAGPHCHCSCCRFLAGVKVHGLMYGRAQ